MQRLEPRVIIKQASLVVLGLAVAGAFALTSCKQKQRAMEETPNFSYVGGAPGPRPIPTHGTSVFWISLDGPGRFSTVHELITKAGQRCPTVLRAVLKSGAEGIDEWRVSCSDTREWAIWLKPNGRPEVLQCLPAYCN